MAQESYADFSIIQKYLDLKRYHDEEINIHKAKITELENTINVLRNESDAREQAIIQLNNQLKENKIQLEEKERSLQKMNRQIQRLNKQLEQTRIEKSSQIFEEDEIKKSKFSFLKK